MSSEPVISARDLGKCYQLYDQPQDRLKQFLWRGRRQYFREFWALRATSFDIAHGEVIGLIGRNGAGKSTLLQLLCGTLTPTTGTVHVHGRVAALLELGAGFNPEFSGRENVFMYAAILGLSKADITSRFEDIVDFSGIRPFIDQPVKTYSSGMFVRLAFAVAVSVDPDILVIDEALSVGDGEFARRSFERIMALKDAGKTILFCSHSTYQIEALCNRVFWLRDGSIVHAGDPATVVSAYNDYLAGLNPAKASAAPVIPATAPPAGSPPPAPVARGTARIVQVTVTVAGKEETPDHAEANQETGRALTLISGQHTLAIRIEHASDPQLPIPSVAVCLQHISGMTIASAGSHNDGLLLHRDAAGHGVITLRLPNLPLLKGEYSVDAYLLCERGLHTYEHAAQVARLQVTQNGLEIGLVHLPHRWETT